MNKQGTQGSSISFLDRARPREFRGTGGLPRGKKWRDQPSASTKRAVATATQLAGCLTKSMKPTYMLRVLDTCRYQISPEGYSKPSAGGKKSETYLRDSSVTRVSKGRDAAIGKGL